MTLLNTGGPLAPDPNVSNSAHNGLVIGLINNMPDPALRSTERQFRALLSSAAPDVAINLRLYSLPEHQRTEVGRQRLSEGYDDLSDLWANALDALIVTGTEPRAASLAHEPYWHTFTRLVQWAEKNTISTIWSCLAAHAAVQYLDGLERCRLARKLCGVFQCGKAMTHGILDGLPASWYVPHSRYNDLPEEALISQGYGILSRSARAGVDMFVRQGRSLFLFVQGHPEYDADALLREYRRDVRKFLAGESDCFPDLPGGYLDRQTVSKLDSFRRQVLERRNVGMASDLTAMTPARPTRSWQQPATMIYANWVSYLMEQKAARLRGARSTPCMVRHHKEFSD